jgi:hypothetical protein
MALIKYTSGITLFVSICCFGMHLTQQSLTALVQEQRNIIEMGKKYLGDEWHTNNLIKKYQELSQGEDQLASFFNQADLQQTIIYLHHRAYIHPYYQAARQSALVNEGEKMWSIFQNISANLIQNFIATEYKITCNAPYTTVTHLQAHAKSDNPTIGRELAKIFLVYYLKDFEREQTNPTKTMAGPAQKIAVGPD